MTLRHLITSEYPPQPGGVSDYSAQVARALSLAGEEVHVWCPAAAGDPVATVESLFVHRELGGISPADLRSLGEKLDRFPAPRRILVQWVPHGYGYRSMNLPFCWWLRNRARHGDRVEIMVHEAFLGFGESLRQDFAALVHRLMTIILLRAATRVWVSIPECERRWKPYTLGRAIPFQWLPVPNNIPMVNDPQGARAVRARFAPNDETLLGHLGTYGGPVASVLEPILLQLCADSLPKVILLMGINSEEFRERLVRKNPSVAAQLLATGPLAPADLSRHISACDLLIQPYPDGASSRRGSLMAGIAHGQPVVTTAGPGTEPVWSEYAAVGLAPAGDAESFVNLVHALSQDPVERGRVSQAAAKLYRDKFDISYTIAALHHSPVEDLACVF
jgi:glycosyltransferase involved in cell wall biosynthesis